MRISDAARTDAQALPVCEIRDEVAKGRTVPTVSAMRIRQTTTASRLRQKPETDTLFSTSESLFSRLRMPMS